MRDKVFISHRSDDKQFADLILNFLTSLGIDRNKVFCSSLPGNAVQLKISDEIRQWIDESAVAILLLSRKYYESAFCLNEAGIFWYLKDVASILIGVDDIRYEDMKGFLGSDYKLRTLQSASDIAFLYDRVVEKTHSKPSRYEQVTQETRKLQEAYQTVRNLKQTDANIDDDDHQWFNGEDIWNDGYHERKDGDGNVIERGQYSKGKLVDGIFYDVILEMSKERDDGQAKDLLTYGDEYEEQKLLYAPVTFEDIQNGNWSYSEIGQIGDCSVFSMESKHIRKLGLEYFYVADKHVQLKDKTIEPTFKNLRTLESVLSEKDPDVLEYIRTGNYGYEESNKAKVEI